LIGEIRRGGLYYADFGEYGDRTVLVVSWDVINNSLRSPVVCQITISERERNLPTYVLVPAGEGGLGNDSYVLCHEIATLDAEDLRREIGTLPAAYLVQVEAALKRTLDLQA